METNSTLTQNGQRVNGVNLHALCNLQLCIKDWIKHELNIQIWNLMLFFHNWYTANRLPIANRMG